MKPPIEMNDIKDFAYITSRKLQNERDEKSGAVFMWRRKGEEEFNYQLKCPYCIEEQELRVGFKKRPYRVKCSNCGKSIMVEKRGKK